MTISTTTDFNGLFKQAYADEIQNLIPEASLLTRNIDFQGRDKKMGDQYNQPVVLRAEQGFTYAAPNSGAFNINPAITMQTKNAVVTGFQILERAGIDYESVAKADGVNSFKDAVDLSMENAFESFGKRLELSLMYGQSATGLMGLQAASANVNATNTFLLSTTGQWASGIWAGAEGAQLDVFSSTNVLLNTVGAVTVVSVDVPNKKIKVSGAAGDITAIDGATLGYVRYFGAVSNEMAGLDKILTNVGSLFGIDVAQYALWGANSYAVGGVALTQSKLDGAVALAQARGLAEDVDVLVNPSTWGNLLNEQNARRLYDSSYEPGKLVNGNKAIEFYSANGKMTIHSHIYVKEGEAFMLPFARAVRVGSTDVTFNIPGTMDGKVFQQQPNNAGFEYRLYSQQSLLIETPAKCVKLTGIVNS